ncbi:MAG: hypothetical protein KY464_10840 [Gemmatimonadetes bacterium]|nr:hypothetical protein [Gemmatimonadota bacterium]
MENRNDGQSTAATPADDEIAREGAALGAAGISRSTGTGSAGSGIAAAGGADQVGPAHHGTTGGGS